MNSLDKKYVFYLIKRQVKGMCRVSLVVPESQRARYKAMAKQDRDKHLKRA